MVVPIRGIGRVFVVALVALFSLAPSAASVAFAQETESTPTDPVALVDDTSATVPAVEVSPTVLPDTTAPVMTQPANLLVEAVDASGAVISYAVPTAFDAVEGAVLVSCNVPPGSLFPIGTSTVTCYAQDSLANGAAVSFTVTVNPLPAPVVTIEPTTIPDPTATLEPVLTATPPSTETEVEPVTPTPTATSATEQSNSTDAGPVANSPSTMTAEGSMEAVESGSTVDEGAKRTEAATAPESVTASVETVEFIEPALALPWLLPDDFVMVTGSGPLGRLAMIWGGQGFEVSQEYGHTAFSLRQPTMYLYGLGYGLDGRQHTGLDVGMPRGTWLYSPVEGTVINAGGTPYFTFYGNGEPGVGELLIRTDTGDEVVLGHMGAIAVQSGQRVTTGQFVGLSGGENGDHLHLETRALQPGGGYLLVDPRNSFLVEALASFESLLDDPLTEDELLDDSVVDPAERSLTSAAAFSSSTLNEGLTSVGSLGDGLNEESIVDPRDSFLTEAASDPFLPDDPISGEAMLTDFIVDPRTLFLDEGLSRGASLPKDGFPDEGVLEEDLVSDSVVNLDGALLGPELESEPVSGEDVRVTAF